MTTRGENLVRTTFNPDDRSDVQFLKSQMADLINLVERIDPEAHGAECSRHKALAVTALEQASMYGVKALTGTGDQ